MSKTANSQPYPGNIFWSRKWTILSVFYSLKNNLFSKLQTLISHSYLISQSFKGTVANLALPFLHGGSLEITLTVPLKRWKRRGQRRKLHILEILLPGLSEKIKTNTYYKKHTNSSSTNMNISLSNLNILLKK